MTPTDIRDTAIPEDVETFSAIDLRFQIATVAPVQAAALWAMPGVIAAMNVYFKAAIMAATEAERERCSTWHPIRTCPLRENVDLWCVYGGEEYAQYDGGASIGRPVHNRFKHENDGFFGNQSNDGVPQAGRPDLVPVAWRPANPSCPAQLIADVMGIPLTLEDALCAPIQEKTP